MLRGTGQIFLGKTRYLHCMETGIARCTPGRRWRTSRPPPRSSATRDPSGPVLVRHRAALDSASRPLAELAAFRRAVANQAALANPAFTLQTPSRGDALGPLLPLALRSLAIGPSPANQSVMPNAHAIRSCLRGFPNTTAQPTRWPAGRSRTPSSQELAIPDRHCASGEFGIRGNQRHKRRHLDEMGRGIVNDKKHASSIRRPDKH